MSQQCRFRDGSTGTVFVYSILRAKISKLTFQHNTTLFSLDNDVQAKPSHRRQLVF